MAYYPYYGFNGFEEVLMQWEQLGVFDILLPLLLIFTVVYAILDRTKIFGKDKTAINAITAIVIAVLSINNIYVMSFFKILFAQVALGIALLIAAVLMTGLLVGKKAHGWRVIITIFGFIIFIWMFSRAADEYQRYYGVFAFGLFTSDWWMQNASWMILLAFIVIVVAAVIAGSQKKHTGFENFAKLLVGEEDY